jgi:hypothetical protein
MHVGIGDTYLKRNNINAESGYVLGVLTKGFEKHIRTCMHNLHKVANTHTHMILTHIYIHTHAHTYDLCRVWP